MAAIEVGRLCVKNAGRDSGKECVIISIEDKNFVTIDGNTRRRKSNVDHLELLPQKADIKKGATHDEVIKALEKLGVKIVKRAPPKEKKAPTEEKPAPKEKKKLLSKLKKPEKKEEKPAPKKA